jgi:hypothetical protein
MLLLLLLWRVLFIWKCLPVLHTLIEVLCWLLAGNMLLIKIQLLLLFVLQQQLLLLLLLFSKQDFGWHGGLQHQPSISRDGCTPLLLLLISNAVPGWHAALLLLLRWLLHHLR